MKKICVLIFILSNVGALSAQDSLGNLTELQHLLQIRKDRFQEYATAADQRTGIFGTKTKKDLEQSREILLQIVKTDNNILNALNQAIVRRGMAKADYSYDEIQNSQTIERLTEAADTLNKQLITAREINDSLEKKTGMQSGINYILIGIIVFLSISFLWRATKSSRAKTS